ncbi:hypothetical protein B0H11DRAFT_2133609, partial [Mycena galericulata]
MFVRADLIPLLFDVLLPLLIPATSSTRARTSPGTCHHLLASASTRARLRCALHTTLALPIEPGGLPPLERMSVRQTRLGIGLAPNDTQGHDFYI